MQTRGGFTRPDSESNISRIIDDALTTRSEITNAARTQQITQTMSVQVQYAEADGSLPSSAPRFDFTFDQDLKTSRVYKRAALRQSELSLPSSAARSLNWSFFSGKSLASISDVSVLSLPVFPRELWNPEHYMTGKGNPKTLGMSSSEGQGDVKVTKVVLLGDQCSGKSTILKQFSLLQRNGFTKNARVYARPEVYQFVVDFLNDLSQQSPGNRQSLSTFENRNLFLGPIRGAKGASALLRLIKTESPTYYLHNYPRFVKNLWREYCLVDSSLLTSAIYENARYYFNDIERLAQPDYLPTDQDILRLYTRTTGLYESCFNINHSVYRVTDVGAERSKWNYCFDSVNYIFFTVSLTGYSETVYNEPGTRMDKALTLFASLATSLKRLQLSTFVIIFTKLDIFRNMIYDEPIATHFPGFQGGDHVEEALDYFKCLFASYLIPESSPITYFEYVNATDTDAIKKILEGLH